MIQWFGYIGEYEFGYIWMVLVDLGEFWFWWVGWDLEGWVEFWGLSGFRGFGWDLGVGWDLKGWVGFGGLGGIWGVGWDLGGWVSF